MESMERLFDMFLHTAAVFAALEVLYVCLLVGGIYVILRALR